MADMIKQQGRVSVVDRPRIRGMSTTKHLDLPKGLVPSMAKKTEQIDRTTPSRIYVGYGDSLRPESLPGPATTMPSSYTLDTALARLIKVQIVQIVQAAELLREAQAQLEMPHEHTCHEEDQGTVSE